MSRTSAGRVTLIATTAAAMIATAACSGTLADGHSRASEHLFTPSTAAPSTTAPSTSSTPAPVSSSAAPMHTHRPSATPTPTPSRRHRVVATRTSTHPAAPPVSPPPDGAVPYASGHGPTIVLDPGHSVSVSATDPANGLDVSDYENEPEMRDVWAVALIVRQRLLADGYRVVMTKTSLDEPTSLLARAQVANREHAALALSIHDQAGSNGGIGFRSGNNTVYYQSVGTYRAAPNGHRTYFTDRQEAAVSKRYGAIFQRDRERAQGVSVALQGNVGYDLGSRGLAPGNIWIVQLLSHSPWIYNEAGGNSAGQTGLDAADENTYASGLVASVEDCVPR